MPDAHHLSQAAHDRLSAELQELTTRGRIEIADKIEAARKLGDLSENGDYHAAKEEQAKLEGRIVHLTRILTNAEIIDTGNGSDNDFGVILGSVVTVLYDGDDEPERFLVGVIEERQDDVVVVSPGSPMGEALLGATEGDAVEFDSPSGRQKVTVVEVS
ncbi:MAG: transcription elongation factor GreA [Acidimicrobiaceae bacterium]|nr:transcription elongation factor GreA [Acidimicrobiaceae bacterium]MDE0515685.1 transcription elongation factor GreA [Acidimicrobiaceae bacterium]MDE0655270.1 transcription elongation factor GreA [Acidimicrobiaceae bacterium]MXZ95048.1 transcription elongation factor GreA [Acidimicrobiaceae bacterium]MYF43403.1 transcription elongation factor GreA [Acidimicrobiaceae bacterium]